MGDARAHRGLVVLALLGAHGLGAHGSAHAGGLDIPTLYGARHAGMGGNSTAYVDDASSVLHNPAGLGHLHDAGITTSFSLFLTNLQTSPEFANQNVSTGETLAPTFLVAGGYRLHPRVVAGLGVYPIGASGGHFEYVADRAGEQRPWLNEQLALAVEIAPGVAVNLPFDLRVGAAYRITALRFQRRLGDRDDPRDVDIDLTGFDFTGVRLGVQWQPLEALELGATYRHQVSVTGTADSGELLGFDLENVESTLVVPAKLTLGARAGIGNLGLGVEADFIRNSQFKELPVTGTLPAQGDEVDVRFAFHWRDSVTLKLGGEYDLDEHWTTRAGYAFDARTTNPRYPAAFGSPPTDNHYLTVGGGYDGGPWRVDLALMHRPLAVADLRVAEVADSTDCRFCAKAGRYKSRASALFVDFSYDFGAESEAARVN